MLSYIQNTRIPPAYQGFYANRFRQNDELLSFCCFLFMEKRTPAAFSEMRFYSFYAKVTTVPVFPSRASTARSKLVMMVRLPGLARTNFMAASTLGSILPTPN